MLWKKKDRQSLISVCLKRWEKRKWEREREREREREVSSYHKLTLM
jgi:hypothetical protein